jgi:CAAX prenyl protease-like protein
MPRKSTAYVAPMLLFVGLLSLVWVLQKIGNAPWLSRCEYWIYPLQTILCGILLIVFWKEYPLSSPKRPFIGIAVGIFVFIMWISPQAWLGFPARTDGFNPEIFGRESALYWPNVAFRFLRLVVVVPLVEEIFWRGFLLRYLIREDFESVAIGTFSWLSFLAVAAVFAFSHSSADWAAAFATGLLYNGVAYWTKSLSTCVLTHAITNLLLGLWIMHTGQWGFW